MDRVNSFIEQLAAAFCMLEKHNHRLYVEALTSLVAMALSEERLRSATSIEQDLKCISIIREKSMRVAREIGRDK